MHLIEPHYNWQHLYIASEDKLSPFYNTVYSEFEYSNTVYNYFIHPQWDNIGSSTLYIKNLYTDYEEGFSIIEMIGEWNDCIYNDIMYLKRNVIDVQIEEGITKFILIGENVMNYHSSDDSYYEEWADETENGWIVGINFREHVLKEFESAGIDNYIGFFGTFNEINWRVYQPSQLFEKINSLICKSLNP